MSKTTQKEKSSAPDIQTEAEQNQRQQRQQVATLQPARLPYHPIYQERYGVDGMMWRALVEAVYPSAKTVEGIILAVSYCKSKNYDVMKKMVHVVPIWNSQLKKEVEGVWEAVSALRATAFRTGQYAGCDETNFGPTKTFHFDDKVGWGEKAERIVVDVEMPEWAQMTVYRFINGIKCKFPGPRVYYIGAYGAKGKSEIPNDKWGVSGDSYMLEKCAEAAALRKAFPEELGGVNAAEEMEGRKFNIPPGETIDHEPIPARPTKPSATAAADQAREMQDADTRARGGIPDTDSDEEEAEVVEHDPTTGEIKDGAEPEEQIDNSVFAGAAAQIIEKITKIGSRKALDNLVNAVAKQEIEALPEQFRTQVKKAYDDKCAWFAK